MKDLDEQKLSLQDVKSYRMPMPQWHLHLYSFNFWEGNRHFFNMLYANK